MDDSVADVLKEPNTLCLEKKELMNTLLNHPEVIRYSKLQNVRKAFDTIYLSFNENDVNCILPPYIQQGDILKITYESDSLDTINNPVYEFTKINIQGDSAYVLMEFDISGAIAYGSLKRIHETWVPDNKFVFGVR